MNESGNQQDGSAQGDDDFLAHVLGQASMFEEMEAARKKLRDEQNAALKEKDLLPDGFESTEYTAYVQPEDGNVNTEEMALRRFQTRRFPLVEVMIVWDWTYNQQTHQLESTIGNVPTPPNSIPATRSGMVLTGPKREGGGLPMMVMEE